ncbi:MAG: HipA domain-containing protein [bacterium]|nr:HipA domain-containing protein [bacterium]
MKQIDKGSFCGKCADEIWSSRENVTYKLDFDKKKFMELQTKTADHMSISGVQDKISLVLKNGKLEPTEKGGEYILKPVPSFPGLELIEDVPANEHITMRIAEKFFNIKIAPCAIVTFTDGELAYLVKRFDRNGDKKFYQEDFCQLSNRTEVTHGKNYKYDSTYEEVGNILYTFSSTALVEIEKLYRQIIFCYIFSNGDAHLKNFSVLENHDGDYVLSPAYDLMATSIHFPYESRTALDLFNTYESESFKINGFYKREDFLVLADMYKIKRDNANGFLDTFLTQKDEIVSMIKRSFLSKAGQERYIDQFFDRLKTV